MFSYLGAYHYVCIPPHSAPKSPPSPSKLLVRASSYADLSGAVTCRGLWSHESPPTVLFHVSLPQAFKGYMPVVPFNRPGQVDLATTSTLHASQRCSGYGAFAKVKVMRAVIFVSPARFLKVLYFSWFVRGWWYKYIYP